jgi:hypothetical protein
LSLDLLEHDAAKGILAVSARRLYADNSTISLAL